MSEPINEFSALRRASGMSLAETADFLNVRFDTVRSWSTGRRTVAQGALGAMRCLVGRQLERAVAVYNNEPVMFVWPAESAREVAFALGSAIVNGDFSVTPNP